MRQLFIRKIPPFYPLQICDLRFIKSIFDNLNGRSDGDSIRWNILRNDGPCPYYGSIRNVYPIQYGYICTNEYIVTNFYPLSFYYIVSFRQ